MARKVVVTQSAALGLDDARRRFTQFGAGSAAKARLRSLRAVAKRLRVAPCTYSESPEHPGCRYVICEGYFFLYAVIPDIGINATAGDVILLAVLPPGVGGRLRP